MQVPPKIQSCQRAWTKRRWFSGVYGGMVQIIKELSLFLNKIVWLFLH